MANGRVKISELTEASSTNGLYTIATDADNRSVKVSVDRIKQDVANEAANEVVHEYDGGRFAGALHVHKIGALGQPLIDPELLEGGLMLNLAIPIAKIENAMECRGVSFGVDFNSGLFNCSLDVYYCNEFGKSGVSSDRVYNSSYSFPLNWDETHTNLYLILECREVTYEGFSQSFIFPFKLNEITKYISVRYEGGETFRLKYATTNTPASDEFRVERFVETYQYGGFPIQETPQTSDSVSVSGNFVTGSNGRYEINGSNLVDGCVLDDFKISHKIEALQSTGHRRIVSILYYRYGSPSSRDCSRPFEFEVVSTEGVLSRAKFLGLTPNSAGDGGRLVCTERVNFDLSDLVCYQQTEFHDGSGVTLKRTMNIGIACSFSGALTFIKGGYYSKSNVVIENPRGIIRIEDASSMASNEAYLTQSEYEAMAEPDPGKTYYIYEDEPGGAE